MPDPSIRIATPEDAAAIAAIYAPYVLETTISFETEAPDAAEIAQRMTKAAGRYPWLVHAAADEVLGYAYASAHRDRSAYRWSVDVSVYLDPRAHRRGIGRGLYQRLLRILELQGFHGAYAGIALPNAASIGLHEACGFTPVGVYREVGYKFGAWRDVGWWGLTLAARSQEPSSREPAPPRPFDVAIFEASA
jgi:phosphinothricin acetyltransferase